LSTGEKFLSNYFSDAAISTLITLLGVSVILGFLLTGILADKLGRKPMIIFYSIMLPASMFVTVLGANAPTNKFAVVAIGYCLTYVAYWGLLSAVRTVTFETLETDKRGTGSGFRGFCYALGITAGLLIGSGITAVSSLGVSYTILSLFVIADIPLTLKFIKETKGKDLSAIDA
jgi:MFS family permease